MAKIPEKPVELSDNKSVAKTRHSLDRTDLTKQDVTVDVESLEARLCEAIEHVCQQCLVFTDYIYVSGNLSLDVDDSQKCEIVIRQKLLPGSVSSAKQESAFSVTENKDDNTSEKAEESVRVRLSVPAEKKDNRAKTRSSRRRKRGRKAKNAQVEETRTKGTIASKAKRSKKLETVEKDDVTASKVVTKRGTNRRREKKVEGEIPDVEIGEEDESAEIDDVDADPDYKVDGELGDTATGIDEGNKEALQRTLKTDDVTESDLLQCEKCEFVAEEREALRLHLKSTHGYNLCDRCPHAAATKNRLRIHLQHAHGVTEAECDECGKVCASRRELREHARFEHCDGWRCLACHCPFPSKDRLQAHMAETHPEAKQELIYCERCEKVFESEEELHTHNTTAHTFICDLCPERFVNASRLITHRQKAHPQYALTCGICRRQTPTRSALVKHMMRHKEKQTGGFKCDICDKVFTAKSTLYHHKRGVHHENKKYHCGVCDMSFNFHHSWKLHTYKHTGKRPYPCRMCSKAYLTASHLKDHVEAVHSGAKKFVCPICSKAFPYDNSLRMHMLLHSEERPFCCELCGKMFVSKSALKSHEELHSDEVFACDVCNKTYKTKSLLRAHQRRHTSDGHRYMCDICGTTFMYSSCLQSHKAIHGTEREFECKECGKFFKTSATLYSHRLVHSDKIPFSCQLCSKAFKTRERLKAHERRHLGQKPFSCVLCGSTFPDRGGLSKHTKTVHASKPRFKCPVCGKLANRADNLRVHMKVHSDVNLLKLTQEELMIKDSDAQSDSSVNTVILMPPRKKRGLAAVEYLRNTSQPKPGTAEMKEEGSNLSQPDLLPITGTEAESKPAQLQTVTSQAQVNSATSRVLNASFQTQPADLSIHSQNNVAFLSVNQSNQPIDLVSSTSSEILSIQALQSLSATPHAPQVVSSDSSGHHRNSLSNAHVLSTTITNDGQLRAILNTNPLLTLAEVMSSAHAQENASLAHVIQPDGVNYTTLQQYPPFTATEPATAQQANFSFQS